MKKHELLTQAMIKFPKETKFTWPNDTIPYTGISNGIFNIGFEKQVYNDDGHVVFNGSEWAEIIPEKPSSILDGKVAIQVNNEREFKLLMEHYESKGWKWNGRDKPSVEVSLTYPTNIEYENLFCHSIDNLSKIYTIIPFEAFAKEAGITVPVFIMKSEDGFDLYEGDLFHEARLNNSSWVYLGGKNWYMDEKAMAYRDNINSKAFSTKESAEAWIEKANKPKSIIVAEESSYPIEVFAHECVIQCKVSNRHSDNVVISSEELESIYKAYQSLNHE